MNSAQSTATPRGHRQVRAAVAALQRRVPQPRVSGCYDRDVFIYQPAGESAGGLSGVRFSIDPTRQADRVLIENLDIHGLGMFVRVK
jgi:hypothetical protein